MTPFVECPAFIDDGHADHWHSCVDQLRHNGDHICGCGEMWANNRGGLA